MPSVPFALEIWGLGLSYELLAQRLRFKMRSLKNRFYTLVYWGQAEMHLPFFLFLWFYNVNIHTGVALM